MYCFQRHRQSALALLAALALAACGAPGTDEADAADAPADSTATDSTAVDSTKADTVAARSDAVPVETAQAVRGDISSYLVFSSTVETEAAIEVHPEVAGQVEEVAAEEGDQVRAGQLLVRLDNGDPFLIERRMGEGRLLLMPANLDNQWNDLPVRPVFVSFMIESARYLSGASEISRTYTAGATLPLAVTGASAGQVIAGGVVSLTVTLKVPAVVVPAPSSTLNAKLSLTVSLP